MQKPMNETTVNDAWLLGGNSCSHGGFGVSSQPPTPPPLEDKNGHLIKKVGKGYELVYDERCEVCKKNHKEKMIPTQIIDVAVRDICQVAVTAAPKSEVREIVVKAIKEILEEVVGSDETKIRFEDEQYPGEKDFNRGWNGAKAEIRANAAKVLGE